MTSAITPDEFSRELECVYDGECYSVRDNGAVLRLVRLGKRVRPNDNRWTFGKPNAQNGYMYIGQVRVHRVVATAFHGEPPTPEHVVDHVDTNRRNNRPENLRWLTRLENALLNPITVKRIEFICGSIEAFLENPSMLGEGNLERNFEWMRTVSAEEAAACKERMQLWTKSKKPSTGAGTLGDWLFKPLGSPSERMPVAVNRVPIPVVHSQSPALASKSKLQVDDLIMAKTSGAAQREWKTPTEFPCCPVNVDQRRLDVYLSKLKAGQIFSSNQFSSHIVVDAAATDDNQSIVVMCEANGLKGWSLAKITFEGDLFIHTSISTYFTKQGAEKQYTLARGLEWTGEDSVDDYC